MQEKKNIDDLLMQVDLTPDSLQKTEIESETINNEEPKELTKEDDNSTPDYGHSEELSNDDKSEELTTDDYGQKASKKEKRSEEHTSELQSQSNLVCRLLLEK